MTLVVRAYPVKSRKAVDEFVTELRERRGEVQQFFASFNVARETWHYQETPHGAIVIGVTEVKGPVEPVARAYKETEERFAAWFKQRVLDISGVNPNETPLGPDTEMVFDSTDV